MLREFWRDLTATVHPADQPVLDANRHTFNLDFPPPAFVGDPGAPLVILYANGGYDPTLTPAEFADPGAGDEYRARLHGLSAGVPAYYRSHALGPWLEDGRAVRVNAVAYRSRRLSAEPENRALAEQLASLALHRRWLADVVLPDVQKGRRFLIVHRNGMWKLDRASAAETVVFSGNPISPWPAAEVMERARAWLAGRTMHEGI